MSCWIRHVVDLTGIVQGVGFRPALHRLATAAGLGGWVQNRTGTVRLALEGPEELVQRFLDELPSRLPPRARVDSIRTVELMRIPPGAHGPFHIRYGGEDPTARPGIPPDMAMCDACRVEVLDPSNRRYGYPFTTCCDCGPRYTVIESMPYDRVRTTMRVFPLCAACQREYEDPSDRRFHAESIACPICGPRLQLVTSDGQPVSGEPIRVARAALAAGRIVALRGMGGFLLAVDATQPDAVRRLRERKRRPSKPLAVMARDLDTLLRYVVVPDELRDALGPPVTPIVILDPTPLGQRLVEWLSPDTGTIGIMLPATPLQLLLGMPLRDDPVPPFDLLVMTSGNRSGAPICLSNEEALTALRDVADLLLLHNREIQFRADDSLATPRSGTLQVWRRARGWAPEPVRLHRPLQRSVLAMGAELKNTVAVAEGNCVWMSPHIGDLEAPEAVAHLRKVATSLPDFLRIHPSVVAVDLHPDYHSTRLGEELALKHHGSVVRIQHHHAHAVAVLAEHGCESGLVLAWDGTGLGPDGTIWGAELFLLPNFAHARRLASFRPAPLLGGDAAVREPVRQIFARWLVLKVDSLEAIARRLGIPERTAEIWQAQVQRSWNVFATHAAGRVFDSVAAALHLAPETVTYEGQTAVRLEARARPGWADESLARTFWSAELEGEFLWVDWSPLFRWLYAVPRLLDRVPDIARTFHAAMVQAALRMVEHAREQTGMTTVGMSGGVFMNRLLHESLSNELEHRGFRVLTHQKVAPNDGGVAFGQAVIAGTGEPWLQVK